MVFAVRQKLFKILGCSLSPPSRFEKTCCCGRLSWIATSAHGESTEISPVADAKSSRHPYSDEINGWQTMTRPAQLYSGFPATMASRLLALYFNGLTMERKMSLLTGFDLSRPTGLSSKNGKSKYEQLQIRFESSCRCGPFPCSIALGQALAQLILGVVCMVMIANLQYGRTFFVPSIQPEIWLGAFQNPDCFHPLRAVRDLVGTHRGLVR